MKKTNIVVTAVMIIAVVSGIINTFPNSQTNKYLSGIISSLQNKDFIEASGEYGGNVPFVTVAVEAYTQNHLPNITGTCSVGDMMDFTIKKGATGVVSETFSKLCDVSPYATNPTISLPDGKYRVDVKVKVQNSICGNTPSAVNSIDGTAIGEVINGTSGIDSIRGMGGSDVINAGDNDDTILASLASVDDQLSLNGDQGCDTIIGSDYSQNRINGSNNIALGIGEQDTLTEGRLGLVNSIQNIFVLMQSDCSGFSPYYIGNGDNDHATITNFNKGVDKILYTLDSIDTLVFTNGITSLYRSGDLVAKINSPSVIDSTDFIGIGCT